MENAPRRIGEKFEISQAIIWRPRMSFTRREIYESILPTYPKILK